ncbi:MAG: response regulator [Deltaproteobacteria bacterium]|nr:response regulator [Deltaproteobacteria bacterium]MBW2401056.1 response regulator [Deltaproteobacteria bacterium]MBW2667872.1 response regulator [Deltaproteobacteria bacterium]
MKGSKPPAQTELPAAEAPLLGFEHRTILLVDDDPAVLRAADRILTSRGHKVLRAQDGVEALEVFEAHRDIIDVAVLDLSMPRRGGLDAAHELRSRCPDLPILFSSGSTRRPNGRRPCPATVSRPSSRSPIASPPS